MQSRNMLWLGLLFVLLLTVFCITKFIDNFHPQIEKVTSPAIDIIDEIKPTKPLESKLVEVHEVIPTAPSAPEIHEKSPVLPEIKPPQEPIMIAPKEQPPLAHTPIKQISAESTPQFKETILAQQLLEITLQNLTSFEKYQLDKIIQTVAKNHASTLVIKAPIGKKRQNILAYLKQKGIQERQIDLKTTHEKRLDIIKITVIKKD